MWEAGSMISSGSSKQYAHNLYQIPVAGKTKETSVWVFLSLGKTSGRQQSLGHAYAQGHTEKRSDPKSSSSQEGPSCLDHRLKQVAIISWKKKMDQAFGIVLVVVVVVFVIYYYYYLLSHWTINQLYPYLQLNSAYPNAFFSQTDSFHLMVNSALKSAVSNFPSRAYIQN